VAGRIKQSIGSVGYVSYEFARKTGLRVAQLENRAGQFVAPTERSASASLAHAQPPENMRVYIPDPDEADAYPIVTLSWILLYRSYAEPHKSEELHHLFRWCLTDGQRYAAELGYVPLPPNIASRSLAVLDSVR
jgi:phosphate transport system substrate-binding protein